MPRISKKFAMLLVLAMLASMFVGMGTVSAATTNSVVGAIPLITATGGPYTVGSLQINEGAIGNFNYNGTTVAILTLPDGCTFPAGTTNMTATTPNGTGTASAVTAAFVVAAGGSRVGTLTITESGVVANHTVPAVITLPILVNVATLGSGALNVNVTAPGTAIQEGNFTIAQFVVGSATATVLNTVSSGQTATPTFGTIRIIENAAGALQNYQTITLRLPAGFTWTSGPVAAIRASNIALVSLTASLDATSQTATFTVNSPGASTNVPAIIDITTPITTAINTAPQDIIVYVAGTANVSGSLNIGNYATYGVTVTADTPTAIQAGMTAQRMAKVTIAENIPASLVGGRSLTLTLPGNAIFEAIPTLQITSGNMALPGTSAWDTTTTTTVGGVVMGNSVIYTLAAANSTQKTTFIIQNALIRTTANAKGDIKLTVGGTGGASGEVVVATAAPVATINVANAPIIQPGLTAQSVGDIEIIEGQAGGITTVLPAGAPATATRTIALTCWDGYQFASVPTVTVTEGNLSFNNIWRGTSNNVGDTIFVQINGMSSVKSTLKFSNIKLDVASYVGTGPAKITVGGMALGVDTNRFPQVTALAIAQVAQVANESATGAAGTSVFTVGSTTYKVNGVEKTAEVAPYVKDGRTYLPIAYVAGSLGIAAGNVIWDAGNQTVTLIKGDKVVQLKIGSKTLLVNGAAITLDAAPEITSGRTCLPISLVAQAFGASVAWDAAAQTVTIK